MAGAVDRLDAGSGQELDAVVAIERFRPHQQQIEADLAVEIVLRQRRTLVRQYRLVADQHDRTVEPGLPQRGGELKAGMAGADDDDAIAIRVLRCCVPGHSGLPHQVCVLGLCLRQIDDEPVHFRRYDELAR